MLTQDHFQWSNRLQQQWKCHQQRLWGYSWPAVERLMYFLVLSSRQVLAGQQLTIKPRGVALTIISVKISIKVVRTTRRARRSVWRPMIAFRYQKWHKNFKIFSLFVMLLWPTSLSFLHEKYATDKLFTIGAQSMTDCYYAKPLFSTKRRDFNARFQKTPIVKSFFGRKRDSSRKKKSFVCLS